MFYRNYIIVIHFFIVRLTAWSAKSDKDFDAQAEVDKDVLSGILCNCPVECDETVYSEQMSQVPMRLVHTCNS